MNDTIIYVGAYIKAQMPRTKVLSDKKICPVCTFASRLNSYCPEHGKELIEFYEIGLAHPYEMIYELFEGDGDRFSSRFYGDDYEEGWVVFLPNHGDQGGQYVTDYEDAEMEIPAYNLDGDWLKLQTYLLENEVLHEVKYGIVVVGEK